MQDCSGRFDRFTPSSIPIGKCLLSMKKYRTTPPARTKKEWNVIYMTKSTVTQDEHEVTNHGCTTSWQEMERDRLQSHTERDGKAGQNMTESCESQFSVKVGTITPPPEPSYEPLTKHCRLEAPGQWSRAKRSNRKYPARLQLHGTAFSQPDPEKMHSPYSLTQIYPPPFHSDRHTNSA
ncbi:uncharacterized protein CLUP02_16083 [Colletotrichum lupini]|uniref:Uncharacterized protein n=1 Tax=Colletotrichum lupini TaxID=145971 RepID=A0A9Q8T7B8_9PEZI|nr:uncharacterized protein CLUP02_16083 [Colletotrichum lupini]UQC90553.1 hypothetical protein CLUP02_16083 [Colletotrichum lupini]